MDNYNTPLGVINITYIGHASLMIEWKGKHLYFDPYSDAGSFKHRPAADMIFITHNHSDHYDQTAYSLIETKDTIFIVSDNVGKVNQNYIVLKNNESYTYEGLQISAVPAYNINHRNNAGALFHPCGVGNGYVLDFGGFRLYIAGDTELIPEMKNLSDIDIAFLPKNLPYTMSDEEFITAANRIHPKYLYPIHFFELKTANLLPQLDGGITLIDTNIK